MQDQKNDPQTVPQITAAFILSTYSMIEIGTGLTKSITSVLVFVLLFYFFRAAIPFYAGNFLDKANSTTNWIFKNFGAGIYLLLMSLIYSIRSEVLSLKSIAISFYTIAVLSILYLAIRGDFLQIIFGEHAGLVWIVIINALSITFEYLHGKTASPVGAPLIAAARKKKINSVLITVIMNAITFIGAVVAYGFGIEHVMIVRGALSWVAFLNTIRLWIFGPREVTHIISSFTILSVIPLVLDNVIFKSRNLCAVKCPKGYDSNGFCMEETTPDAIAVCPIDISGHFYLGLVIITGLSRSLAHLWVVATATTMARITRFIISATSVLFIMVIICFLAKTLTTRHSIFDKIAGAFLGIVVGKFISMGELLKVRDGVGAETLDSTHVDGWLAVLLSSIAFAMFGLGQIGMLAFIKSFEIVDNNNKLKISA